MTPQPRRALKVGIQLPEVEREVRWPELRSMARLAEDVGFDSLWVGDHFLYRNPGERAVGPWDCWSLLAALAAVTSRVELGPLVTSTSFHAPALLAKKAATVDEISGGRLILGLGAGWNETEYRAFGFPFDHRVSRFEEAFTIVRRLLREGRIDFSGVYYQVRDCELLPRPARAHGPPLLVGSDGPRMLRITLPHVDAWNGWYTSFGNRAERLPTLLAKVDAACTEVGRRPADVLRTAAVLVEREGGMGRAAGAAAERGVVEPIRGAPEQVAEALLAYARIGVGHLQLVVDPITCEAIESLAPALALVR